VVDKSNVRETIITKALALFSEKGYEGVSVSELTEASGITKPTLYYYFGSKEGVFEVVSQFYYNQLNTIITENIEYKPNVEEYSEDIYPTLTRVTNAYFTFAKANEAFYRITLANWSMPRSSTIFKVVEKYHFKQVEIIDGMFKKMAAVHGNLKGKSKTLAWSYIGTINSYISLYYSGITGQVLSDKTAKELVHQFMHGIYA
jgi:AcrR family transcriptional regulator